jgi:hypothetical protein
MSTPNIQPENMSFTHRFDPDDLEYSINYTLKRIIVTAQNLVDNEAQTFDKTASTFKFISFEELADKMGCTFEYGEWWVMIYRENDSDINMELKHFLKDIQELEQPFLTREYFLDNHHKKVSEHSIYTGIFKEALLDIIEGRFINAHI